MSISKSRERSWLQVAGLPLDPVAGAVRRELDAVDRVIVTPETSRVLLFDAAGQVVGALDLMPPHKARVDQAVAAEQARVEPAPDPAKGDTVIKPLDTADPEQRALLDGPRVGQAESELPQRWTDEHRMTLKRDAPRPRRGYWLSPLPLDAETALTDPQRAIADAERQRLQRVRGRLVAAAFAALLLVTIVLAFMTSR